MLGRFLGRLGIPVLFVDADPQSSLTSFLGVKVEKHTATLLEALYVTCSSRDTIMRQVSIEARRRLASRKAAGDIRSSITRLENITKL